MSVRDMLAESGLISFLDLNFHLVRPIKELLKMSEKVPTIYA